MKLGAMNNPNIDLLDEISWIAKNGFDFVDLTIEPPKAYNVDFESVKESLAHFDLLAIGHTNPFLPATSPIESIREACLDEFRKYVDIFSQLGIDLMNIHPFYEHKTSSEEEMLANIKLLKEVNHICNSKGITLMLENFIKPFDTPEAFSQIIEEVPGLKVHLDIGHCNLNQEKNLTEEFFKVHGDRIIHVHISDNKGVKDDHLPLGCGNIDWPEIAHVLKKYDYDGTITLEIFSNDLDYLLQSRRKLLELLQ